MKFRELDFWQGLAEDFNQMVERLSGAKNRPATSDSSEADEPALTTR
jgi:hypothetical protein